MTSPAKTLVRVQVGGEELQLRTELPPDYAREVAAHFDEALRKIRAASPSIEAYKAAILAGLSVTDELFRARTADGELASRITALSDELTRLLPPTKRTSRGAAGD
ncbi:MAG TPA: cell division protein ZapA [Gemmatimonadales bacterium]|jgi:cell division protein ZapA (FtsZ GTPase activity inhibitor)